MINISAKDVNFYYGSFHALKNITLGIERNTVTAFIGPSGCGKSTFLRLLNRMNDLIEGTRLSGEIRIDGEDIYGRDVEVVELMGSETYLYLKTVDTGINFIARVDARSTSRAGDKIKIALDANRLHFFDVDTEATILNR